MAKEQDIEKHDKKVIIGQRDNGWWAVNPEPAFIHNDIDKIEILIKAVTSKDQLIFKIRMSNSALQAKTSIGFRPAVGYLRRSTDRQEQSIDDQRKAIERYAITTGFELLDFYTDDAISGASSEGRTEFLRLIDECWFMMLRGSAGSITMKQDFTDINFAGKGLR